MIGQGGEDGIQGCQQVIGVRYGKRHGWPDLEDIVHRSIGAKQDAVFCHAVNDKIRLGAGRLESVAIADQFQALEVVVEFLAQSDSRYLHWSQLVHLLLEPRLLLLLYQL